MEIVVFAEQFRNGRWDVWEHTCSPKEVQAVVSSALARANDRSLNAKPTHDDFLESARSLFEVAHSPVKRPDEGDTRVYCVCVDQLVIGVYEKIRQYSQRLAETHDFAQAGLRMSA